MSIEKNFDISFVASLALREKQIQQNYRPIIAVHKWFARRPGTLFRGLTLAEFGDQPVANLFYKSNEFAGRVVADPFMGGGTPIIEANRLGCDVLGFDINPMSAWIVREAIEHLDLTAYKQAAAELTGHLRREIDGFYRTDCPLYGDADVPVKYFLWVKTLDCEACGKNFDLFPGYLLSEDRRHPKNVLVCAQCGDLNEVENRHVPGACGSCGKELYLKGPARRNRCACPHCAHVNRYPRGETGPLRHRMFAIEYYNPDRKSAHKGRFFKKPDSEDLAKAQAAAGRWHNLTAEYVPCDEIPAGDETDRLHRWGYRYFRELFNPRQLLALELSCRFIAEIADRRVRHALATNLSDLLRYQNMLCRYDTMALKSLDIFSIHGFPVGLVQCESNVLGITNGAGANVGSGGWSNMIDKYRKAKLYCDSPFEILRRGSKNVRVPITGEWIGEKLNGGRRRNVDIRCVSATTVDLPTASLDAVFTDPPYFGNVQYGELMDFCYVWLRRLVGKAPEGFDKESARSKDELTGNTTQSRGIIQFTEGLSKVYVRMARALKPGAPLAFTYHHNRFEAYYAVGVAILDAGLTCSASIPCPGEMAGSIHIRGTASSIVDTVFVCRSSGNAPRRWLFDTQAELASVVSDDLEKLCVAGMKPTHGDIRCITFGHMTRMAIWKLRRTWEPNQATEIKLDQFGELVSSLGNVEDVIATVDPELSRRVPPEAPHSEAKQYQGAGNVISF